VQAPIAALSEGEEVELFHPEACKHFDARDGVSLVKMWVTEGVRRGNHVIRIDGQKIHS
jgi:hypothetical protein